ncbi:MAG: hypothetical protein CO158_01080 [Piscirickettsiaceae bacterium CG_4_9_14_3_um_filter_43_564]|nr:hypothetical protein [Thiomicrospira sp.]OIP94753.1 MAG: hypothetical protein AUK56_08095 [Thiomicrospira sp. CG2_30_44_34]PIQ03171.1 MAG: hypothetical protein COW74_07820 [Piscirickettsiaceae bacterium CG18_big_fil_WC_8_21_14_2_50_44_103]PIU39446.1 MAG: hypothetical protein COT01_01100 [Piscirickettsiaceae bacterium CG07_land_8_20_14_0_80_44_28]PIW58533.1 MAG: hypothetical protein COW14_00520 [Piscirickettsiaceae bacterium CG12_big_fil_rev_8_21_14_0_65_44_934]PIW78392.1 MAG: hypothetical p
MDIGSTQHQSLLYKTIWKMVFKTSALAIVLGGFLMLPSLLRENAFSAATLMLGYVVMITGIGYALWVGWKKHRAIQKTIKSI